ncbi:MAG: aminodeoxychorismate/anthranilate synthase component II, partial [Bacteroidia bacterium]|nr:aminodeoxychorismate/anthranilate synthase component II [Bacteroidia bacterium]
HQYIIQALGGRVDPIGRPLFGVQRPIYHRGIGLFERLPNPLSVGLYHALHASEVPPSLEVVAQDQEGHCMAVCHPTYPVWGLQFHPDSILTPNGRQLLQAWISLIASTYSRQIV